MAFLTIDSGAMARKLMGHPADGTGGTPAEFTVAQMNEALEFGHDQLVLYTKKSNWDANDPIINQLRIIEAYFASSLGRSVWRDPDNKAQEHFNRAKGLCTAIIENQSVTSDEPPDAASQTSTVYNYRTRALNPDANWYKSPRVDI